MNGDVLGREPTRDFDEGVLVGILIGEGHFGGDGKQPQVTLRMHARHERLFRWIEERFPGGRLYGPYHHGGRHYFQWMARGDYLRDVLVPILERRLSSELDPCVHEAFKAMLVRYSRQLGGRPPAGLVGSPMPGPTNSAADQAAGLATPEPAPRLTDPGTAP